MKKFLCLIFILVSTPLFSQQYSYAWLTDIHIGSPNAEEDLLFCINDINSRDSIAFIVVTGDIAEKGKDSELVKAKSLLDNLRKPYYIIPGNHDTKWSESGCTQFSRLWNDDKFVFDLGNTRHIGINSGIYWRGGGGHFTPEDLKWLDSILIETPSVKEIFFYAHHPLDGDIDNWYKATNVLRKKRIKIIFNGHGHRNKLSFQNTIPAVMGRSSLSKGKSAGYTIVSNYPDSISFFESNSIDTVIACWGSVQKNRTEEIPFIDSVAYSNTGIQLEKDLHFQSTLSASLLIYGNYVIAAFRSGLIVCSDFSGIELWRTSVSGTIMSKPTAIADILAVGTIEGELSTFRINSGELIQTIGIDEPITSQLTTNKMKADGEETYGLLIGTARGKLYCYDIFFLNLLWSAKPTAAMIEQKPLILGERIIFGAWDGYLYCLDASTGELNWRWSENKNFYFSPAACNPVTDGKRIFIATPDKFVSCIDPVLGKTIWRKNEIAAWESIGISKDGKKILVKSIQDIFGALSEKDGKKIKEVKAGFTLDTMPIELFESDEGIIFGSKSGFLFRISEAFKVTVPAFFGNSRMHTVYPLGNKRFVASNMDGDIFFFTIP